jgi:dihydroxyacid dehydratase/phosphogluconate dehydratase
MIELDVPRRTLELLVGETELEARRREFRSAPIPARGWSRLYAAQVLPAHQGADLAFLTGRDDDGLGTVGATGSSRDT